MYIERKISESIREKRKYFSKVLSQGAMWANYQRLLDGEDVFSEWAWAESMFFIWLDISSLFIFGLEPYELEPFTVDFDVELPTLEEWLQGIKLKIEKVDVGESWKDMYWKYFKQEVPPYLDFDRLIRELVQPDYAGYILWRKYGKLVVGFTRYGEGYVDPPVVREFLRATFYELLKRRVDLTRLKEVYKTLVEKLGISEGIAESVFNRIVLHLQSLFENFILDYNLLNYSKLCEPGSESATFPIVTWREEVCDVNYKKLAELNSGMILDVTPLDHNILMPEGRFFKDSPVGTTTVASWFVDYKVRKLISRYRATHVAFANYQRPEEMQKFYKSERADQYHQLRLFFYHLDSLVDSILEGEDVDSFRRNLYRKAAAMLIGHRKKRHKWGYEAFKTMSEEEFKQWWIGYWKRQGLKPELLNRIYEAIKTCLPSLRAELEELGRRLKKQRYRLAQALK